MKQVTINEFINSEKSQIDERLPEFINRLNCPESLKQAMVYSLKAGGKRVRPVLLLAVLESCSKPISAGYEVACAIEMIHTYSLIHDDLPAMDDDDLRRGQPTNHKVHGEAMAILAGDALLTYSYELISKADHLTASEKLELIQLVAVAAGPEGMVGGQAEDMEAEGKLIDVNQLENIHRHKTGDLLSVAVEAGAVIAGLSEADRLSLKKYAYHIGIAFQIKDDLLDVEGDEEKLGKRVGSDVVNNKSTYPKLLGTEGARKKLDHHLDTAKKYLYETNLNHTLLEELADYIKNRSS
ncbi:polyprenyl synthetase family protein [Evansella clarkii]|jgi:geranylgeranyl diphosphate synthase type II|uniref:polyprenyl synthetase family protein n=1 Tax=Evansella clarkii TaxID=79879 RepID=UPI000995F20E|nr:farnesyl diphosphate synthase [Evansella clarkii]